MYIYVYICISSVQSLSRVQLIATPWTAGHQASLSITNSQSLPKPMSIESVIPSNHLILCHPLLLLPSIFPSIRVFSNESALCMRWPKYWSFIFNISPSNEHPGWMDKCTYKCTYMCVCVCIYIYICTHLHMYLPTLTHIGSCTNTGIISACASECVLGVSHDPSLCPLACPV